MEELNKELLRYGEITYDHQTEVKDGFLRVRFIEYKNVLYLHVMLNGEIQEIKKI